jgi:BirA family biotin operon repressor/biotin-[acetyl-CoA-carboxylase] ligase
MEVTMDLNQKIQGKTLAQWMEEYRRNCISLHRDVLLLSPTGQREAYAEDIGEDGELLVRLPDGSREAVSMGEVSLRTIYERM